MAMLALSSALLALLVASCYADLVLIDPLQTPGVPTCKGLNGTCRTPSETNGQVGAACDEGEVATEYQRKCDSGCGYWRGICGQSCCISNASNRSSGVPGAANKTGDRSSSGAANNTANRSSTAPGAASNTGNRSSTAPGAVSNTGNRSPTAPVAANNTGNRSSKAPGAANITSSTAPGEANNTRNRSSTAPGAANNTGNRSVATGNRSSTAPVAANNTGNRSSTAPGAANNAGNRSSTAPGAAGNTGNRSSTAPGAANNTGNRSSTAPGAANETGIQGKFELWLAVKGDSPLSMGDWLCLVGVAGLVAGLVRVVRGKKHDKAVSLLEREYSAVE